MKKGWRTETLGDTCEMYQPKTISGKDMVEDGPYLVFGANGVIGRYDKFNHEESELLITCRGATCGSVNVSEPKSWITGNAMVVRSRNGSIDRRFLEYLFRGGIDVSKAITGAAQPQITRTNLEPLEISYPNNLAEQQRIVGILDEAFEGIARAKANAEKNLQNARALFESHLQSVFTHRGDGWVEKSLADIAQVKGGKRVPKGYKLLNEPTDYPYLRVADFNDTGTIEMSDLRYVSAKIHSEIKNYVIYSTDLYMSIAGTIGKTGIIPEDLDGANLTENACRLVFNPGVNNRFVYYFTVTPDFVEQAGLNTRTAAQPKLALSRLSTIKLGIPPLPEQKRLAAKFDALREETQRLASLYTRKLAALEGLKKSLLHQAFSGEL